MRRDDIITERMLSSALKRTSWDERIDDPILELLLRRIATGEQDVLAELYAATIARIAGLARFMLRDLHDAEEVVSATYTQVWQTAAQFNCARGCVLGWMLTICRSRALDLIRARAARSRFVTEDGGDLDLHWLLQPRPEELLEKSEQLTGVTGALASLSELRRQLLILSFMQGLSHAQIAEQTGLPLGTVKSHIRRSLALLRTHIESRPTSVN